MFDYELECSYVCRCGKKGYLTKCNRYYLYLLHDKYKFLVSLYIRVMICSLWLSIVSALALNSEAVNSVNVTTNFFKCMVVISDKTLGE